MTVALSIKGYTSATTQETITLTLFDPKVTRTLTKTDTVYVAYPVNEVTGGGFGFDLGFSEDTFKMDITLSGDTASGIYKKLWYMLKVDSNAKIISYDSQTFNAMSRRITTTQTAGQGEKRTISMELVVVAE